MVTRTQSFNQSQRIGSFDLSAQINSMQKRRRSVGFKFDIAEHVKVECIPKYLDGRNKWVVDVFAFSLLILITRLITEL